MPTNQNAYNSRVTDEALEKRFRDTFTSQGGAELVSDLYASGVIVPIVDFTAAAEGSSLRQDLQVAWDFSTGHNTVTNTTTTIVNTTGFWKVDLNLVSVAGGTTYEAKIVIDSGITTKPVWELNKAAASSNDLLTQANETFIVFLRSGDSLKASTNSANATMDVWYRQIADVSGNLTQPFGFTSS